MTIIPKGYKKSEVGIIPDSWTVFELGDVAPYSGGRMAATKAEENSYVSCENLIKNKGGVSFPASVPTSGSVVKYNEGDILLGNIRPYLEKIWLTNKTGACSSDVLCLQPNIDSVFLYNVLSKDSFFLYVMSNVKGTKMPRGDKKHISQYKFPTPTNKDEQHAIATALSDMDALIEAKTALLEKKRAIKQGAMQELLTGRRRLPGFQVTPLKHTEMGSIPEDWEVKTLGEIGVVKMCKRIFKHETAAEGDIPFFKIGTFGQQPDAYISREKFNAYKSLYPYPHKGTPLISAAGTIGLVVVYDGQDAYYQDSNIVWLEHEEKDILNAFLRYYYSVINWVTETGSAITRLYNNNILSSQVALPTLKEQAAIASVLADMDSEIEAIEHALEKQVGLKQGMMQNLLTGRIRLVK